MNTKPESSLPDNEIHRTLATICRSSSFIYGEVWAPNELRTFLSLTAVNYTKLPLNIKYHPDYNYESELLNSIQQFSLCSQEFIASRGEGLPGRIWLSKKPEWILDVTNHSEDYFLRHLIAKVFGVKTGFGLPVIFEDQVLRVLAFFSWEILPRDNGVIAMATGQAEALANRLNQDRFKSNSQ